MNQRIRELAEHASKLVRIEHPELSNGITMKEMSKLKVKTFLLTEYDVEKFAELIVRECCVVMFADPRLSDVRSATRGCARSIKEHFGVKE